MKKNIKLVALAAALVLGAPLAGCNGNNPSSSSSSSSTSTPVDKNWSEAEQALMREKIGEVLPYIEVAGEWAWDEENSCLSFASSETVSSSRTLEYARSLAGAQFKLDSDSYGDVVATKLVSSGVLNVSEYVIDESETDTPENYFYIDAYIEVPVLDWTDAEKAEMAKLEEGFELPFMYFFRNGFYEEEPAVAYYEDDKTLEFYCSTRGSYMGSYTAILEAEGWVVDDSTVSQYGYATAKALTSKGNIAEMMFGEGSGYFIIDVTITEILSAWPADKIAAFFAGQEIPVEETLLAPACGTKFIYDEETYASMNAVMVEVMDAGEGSAAAYATALEGAGYKVEQGQNSYFADSLNGEGRISIQFQEMNGELMVVIGAKSPIEASWPSEKVAQFTKLQGDDTAIPAVEGCSKYLPTEGSYTPLSTYGITSIYAKLLQIDVLDPVAGLKDTYKTALEGAGYTVQAASADESVLVGLKNNLRVFFGSQDEGVTFFVQIQIAPTTFSAFPSSVATNWYNALGNTGEFVSPEVEVQFCLVNSSNTLQAQATDAGTPGVDAVEDTYKAALELAGWTVDDTYYLEEGYYAYNPEETVEVFFYSYGGYFIFQAYSTAE